MGTEMPGRGSSHSICDEMPQRLDGVHAAHSFFRSTGRDNRFWQLAPIGKESSGRLTSAFAPSTLTPDVRLVVTSGADGSDASPRTDIATTIRGAFLTEAGPVVLPFLRLHGSFGYVRDGDVQVVEVPLEGGLTLLVALPDSERGLPDVEVHLSSLYARWRSEIVNKIAILEVPPFKITSSIVLENALRAAGLPLMFETETDFARLFAHAQDPRGPFRSFCTIHVGRALRRARGRASLWADGTPGDPRGSSLLVHRS